MAGPVDRQAEQQRLQRLLHYIERDPQNLQLVADAAEVAVRIGEKERARELIERGLTLAGGDAARRFAFGNLLMACEDYARAQALFVQLANESGAHPAIGYNIAYAEFGQGRYGDAIATLTAVPEAERGQLPQYDLLLAKALHHDGHIEAALEHIERYVQSAPGDREGLGQKSLIAFDLGRTELAEATARQLLTAHPDDVLGHLTLGSIALERRQPDVAKIHMERLLAQQPQMGRAWSVLAFADLQQNQLDAGRQHFDLAVRHMPNHLGTWHGLAWTQLLLGNVQAARDAVNNAMALDRNFAENHGTLAVLQILDGHLSEAEGSIKRGLRLDPQSPSSHYARSLLLAERNQPEASKKLIERILTQAGMQDAARIAEMAVQFRPGQRPQPAAKPSQGPKPVNKKLH